MLSVRGTLVVEPDLRAVVSAFTDAGADFVLIGGFAVIAHEVLRTTEDCDLLIPDDATNDAAVFSVKHAHAAHQHGHLRRGQHQHVCAVNEQLFRWSQMPVDEVVAEAIGGRFEHRERIDVGLLLGCV